MAARLALAGAVLLLGLLAGLAFAGGRERGEVLEAVRGAVEDAASDRVDSIWDRLAPSTVAHFRESHAGLLVIARWMKEKRGTEERARIMAEETEREHAATLDEILASDPRGFWIRETRRALGGPAAREGLRALEIGEVRCDGKRATVEGRLPWGTTQGFHLVREEGAWRLVDFVPYKGLGEAGRVLPPAPPASPAGAPASR